MALEPWMHKIGNEARKKLERMKQAQSALTIKLSPVQLDVFNGLYTLLANLQPSDGGRHLTAPLQHVAGSHGGEKQEHVFEIVSGKLVALIFKPTFVFSHNQGSLLLRESDGTALAIIAPITFRLRYTLTVHLADFVLTVTYDVVSLPRDGVFRFDEAFVEFSAASDKEEMKSYICGELRKLLTGFSPLLSGGSSRGAAAYRNLLSAQQLVQVDYYAPASAVLHNTAAANATPAAANSSSSTRDVVGAV
eukprot:6213741-Pleurochrysis_carterae.AAC.5